MSSVCVVLSQPQYARNVGAVARAMGNMGATQLILVNPLCNFTDEEAQKAAVGCQAILQERRTYANWNEFYRCEGEGVRIGFTARAGELRPTQDAEELFAKLPTASSHPTYLIFGREDDGLGSTDVRYIHHMCTLKTYGDYSSLNLSQAVLLALYLFQRHAQPSLNEQSPTTAEPMYYPEQTIRRWLEATGFSLKSKRVHVLNTLNRLFLQNQPTDKELRVLEAVLQQNIRKLEHAANQKTE